MKLTGLLFFVIFSSSGYGQVVRIDISVGTNASGQQVKTVRDTTNLEHYRYCSFDQGFRLRQNLPDGTYEVYENDTLHLRAYYIQNKKNGSWTYYYTNGQISSTTEYLLGMEQGTYKRFRKDGSLHSDGSYLNDQMSGWWNDYYLNGQYSVRHLFEHNEKIKQVEFYENGNMKKDESFLNGDYDGKCTEYFENGKVKKILYYDSGRLTRWIWYRENGDIDEDKTFN